LRPGDRRSQQKAKQGAMAKPSQLGEAHPGHPYLAHDKQATPFLPRLPQAASNRAVRCKETHTL
jgi:hypothetical protein